LTTTITTFIKSANKGDCKQKYFYVKWSWVALKMASTSSSTNVKGTSSRLGLADAWGKLRSLRFNQDQSCFVCALDDGLRVFHLDPIREATHLRHELVGSVSRAEMLFKTNLIAFVGGGKKPRFPDNMVMVYDDRQVIIEFSEHCIICFEFFKKGK
jgi:hypothetical protein